MAKEGKEVKAGGKPNRNAKGQFKPPKKIAIVGCSDSKDLAPYDDDSWEIWSMNNAYAHVRRRNLWFEIHPIKKENGKYYRRKLIKPGIFEYVTDFRGAKVEEYLMELARLDIPVLMQQKWDIIPKSEPYPIDKAVKTFGTYFTNSVSYMIAFALMQGATDIGCYGVDMATGSEYGPQRPSCEFFLGIAAGMGVKVTIPPAADLLKTKFLYGFQEREQAAWEEKMAGIQQSMASRRNKAQQELDLASRKVQQYIGAQEAMMEIERIWSNLQTTTQWRDPS